MCFVSQYIYHTGLAEIPAPNGDPGIDGPNHSYRVTIFELLHLWQSEIVKGTILLGDIVSENIKPITLLN